MAFTRRDGYVLWVGGPVPRGADAITLGRLVSVRRGRERSAYLIHHELVHVRQWRRHGSVSFLARYLGSYVRSRAHGAPHAAAYRRIPFEIEADWVARRLLLAEREVPARTPSATG